MKRTATALFPLLLVICLVSSSPTAGSDSAISLPEPQYEGDMSLEKAIATRATARSYSDTPLTEAQLGQLLWAGNGMLPQDQDAVTGATPRAIPSALKTYPIELFAVVGKNAAGSIPAGVYHYDPKHHALEKITDGDKRKVIVRSTSGQKWISQAPVSIVIGSVFERQKKITDKLGVNYAVMEVGNANQNILLQGRTLGLMSNSVSGFSGDKLAAGLTLPREVKPILVVTVGK